MIVGDFEFVGIVLYLCDWGDDSGGVVCKYFGDFVGGGFFLLFVDINFVFFDCEFGINS